MKKILFISLSFLLFLTMELQANSASHQLLTTSAKKTVAIWPFTGENKFGARDGLHGIVTDAIKKSGRFTVSTLQAIVRQIPDC